MANLTLEEFVDRIAEIMPVITKEFLRYQTREFYKVKVTMPQHAILDVLNRSGVSNMSDLARSGNVTTAAMTGVVNRLVRDGYVTRVSDPRDRRVIKVRLTPTGMRTVNMLNKHKRDMITKLFGMLSQGERESYLDILMRIRDRIKS